jgi:hypothetical protein
MRALVILAAMMAAAPCGAACGGAATVRDFGLDRAWVVQRDCDHPERPGTLVEIPWSEPRDRSAAWQGASIAAPLAPPAVKGGMRVVLWQRRERALVQLSGTALGAARVGESVAVRVAWSGATVRGIVRGPDLVELAPGKVGK